GRCEGSRAREWPSAPTSAVSSLDCLPTARSRSSICSAPTSPCSSTNACSCRRRRPNSVAPCGFRSPGPSAASAPSSARGAPRYSPSCKAGTICSCAQRAPASSLIWASTATRSVGLPWASRSRSCCASSRLWRPRSPPNGRAISWEAAGPPAERPRYLRGVATPEDLVEAVARGIDMFACVLPTRNGRHGLAFTRFGPINLKNARHAGDPRPIDEASACPAARDYSRAYLHHLVKANEMLGAILLTTINLAYYQELMADMRTAITAGTFAAFCVSAREGWGHGDASPVRAISASPAPDRRRKLERIRSAAHRPLHSCASAAGRETEGTS